MNLNDPTDPIARSVRRQDRKQKKRRQYQNRQIAGSLFSRTSASPSAARSSGS